MKTSISTLVTAALALAIAGSATAANITISANITTDTNWTADNVYALDGQIYVTNGAVLTIQPGTIIASVPAQQGSLAITQGSQIIAEGTAAKPIIFTSTDDVTTWDVQVGTSTGKNPRTGTWRASANEWGNITIMGRGYISKFNQGSVAPANTATFGNNIAAMEGLVGATTFDPNVIYGGTNDNDDSGSLKYVSLRYGGKVIGLANELNGLSLGGVGRGTEIEHIEIMNNVDDGIEIWGGTVSPKWFSIWNIGDDSFDVDQGWRGKAQFGLIVQGYSLLAAQGSGTGDNAFEVDGAENSNVQPVTTATIYNCTVIGQPVSGDHGTAWRDGARVQYRQNIFMDLGERLVANDNIDGDGGAGYANGGTLAFADIWTTAYTVNSTVNAPSDFTGLYTAQSAGSSAIGQGFLAELTDSVFYRNNNAAAYTIADSVGVTTAGGSNAAKGNVVANETTVGGNENMPITSITRAAAVNTNGTLQIINVIGLDPRAANAALTAQSTAPNDGFFTPVAFRGAFGPLQADNWLNGWSASNAFGYVASTPGSNVGDWMIIN